MPRSPRHAADAEPLRLEDQVCFSLAVASRTVNAVYRPLLEPYGLTHPQYLVMLVLWERSPRSLKEVAEPLLLDSATLSPCLKRLQAAGYVTRARSTSDERVLLVDLTPAGRALADELRDVPDVVHERLRVDTTELRSLNARLTKVIAAATRAARAGR